MEEIIMKVDRRAYNRKKEFQARMDKVVTNLFVKIAPENKYFYTAEGAMYDWRYCKRSHSKRTSKREAQGLRRYRDVCTLSVSKRERRVYDHMFRDAVREREITRYLNNIRNFGSAEELFADELFSAIQSTEDEQPNFKRLPNGLCVYEPPVAEVLEAFDSVVKDYVRENDLYDDEDFLFDTELLRASIETENLTYSDIVETDVHEYRIGKVHQDTILWILRSMLKKASYAN